MPKLRTLSGQDLVKVFALFGFVAQSQKGSHVKLVRLTPAGRQPLVVPNHKELDTGTLRAIFRQASAYIPENDLRPYFYTEN